MIWLVGVGLALLAYVVVCCAIVLILGAVEHNNHERVWRRILYSKLFILFIPLCFAIHYAKKLTRRNRK